MNRRAVAYRVLVERKLARQFQRAIKGTKSAQVGLHLRSILAAALTNPTIVVEEIAEGRAMALQHSTNRITHRPMLLSLPCADRAERETFRRLIQALTWQVAALIDGPVMPDSSSVVRAILAAWLKITVLNPAQHRNNGIELRPVSESTKGRRTRSSRKGKKARSEGVTVSSRRKKPYGWTRSADRVVPHPEFPAVSSVPVDWKPGGKGRPPVGSYRGKSGKWHLPKGFKVIDGKVHPPLEIFREAVSKRKLRRKADRQARKRRIDKSATVTGLSEQAGSEPEATPTRTKEPGEQTSADFPTDQPPQELATET